MPGRVAVSVLTPVHRPVPEYLLELYATLDAQDDVEWEWIVQVDGDASLLAHVPKEIRDDPRVAAEANGRWLGQSVTRNLALVRCRHPLLQTVDADDLLEAGALAAGADVLARDRGAGLAFGRSCDLVDGAKVEGKNLHPPGRIEPGALFEAWEQRGGSCSIVVPSVMWRTAAVDAVCGWPASVAGMDVLLLLAVTRTRAAVCFDRYTYVYRQHAGQIHRGALRHEMRPRYRELARRMMRAPVG